LTESANLESIIRQYVDLPAYPSGKGWYHVLCKVCNDHGRKGKRGGFKFEGDTVTYNCFNCSHAATYNPSRDADIPDKMKTVLRDFGIPDEEWQRLVLEGLRKKDQGLLIKGEHKKVRNIEPPALTLPNTFYYLKDAAEDDKWAMIARDYLEYDRGIDPDSYPFMLSVKTDDVRLMKWFGRVIIPIYKGEKTVFYIGRDLTDKSLKKYESPSESKDCVIYGFDKLFEHTDAPLYIVEGWFDAFAIDGVAILGNKISPEQADWLNRSRRKKVYVPDRFGDGHQAAERALQLGWSISTPDIGSNCKDMNDAVKRYGKLYVMKTLAENTADGFTALTRLGIYCEKSKPAKTGKATKSDKAASQKERT